MGKWGTKFGAKKQSLVRGALGAMLKSGKKRK